MRTLLPYLTLHSQCWPLEMMLRFLLRLLISACLGDAFDLLRIKEQLRFFYALNDVIAFVFFDDFGIAKGLLHFLLSTRRPLFLLDHDR